VYLLVLDSQSATDSFLKTKPRKLSPPSTPAHHDSMEFSPAILLKSFPLTKAVGK
jgi:hypothetical protein